MRIVLSSLMLFCSLLSFSQKISPIVKTEKIPKENEITSATIGVTLVEKYIKETYKGFNSKSYIEESYLGATWGLKPGELYHYKRDAKWDYYLCIDTCIIWQDKMIRSNRTMFKGGIKISHDKKTHRLFNLLTAEQESFGPKVKIQGNILFKDITLIGTPKFRQEFIYGGRAGQNVKFTYREFINDLVRPSFTQEIQYDLDESKIIGFKELKIEIIKLTNTNIEYKVLSHFQ